MTVKAPITVVATCRKPDSNEADAVEITRDNTNARVNWLYGRYIVTTIRNRVAIKTMRKLTEAGAMRYAAELGFTEVTAPEEVVS